MPIKIPNKLPARAKLEGENIFVMTETRAITQDIRPLKIAILNLMPTRITTEIQLLRLLGNTPLQVDIDLIRLDSHIPQNTPQEHLLAFYRPFSEAKNDKFDGLVITGAPVEHLDFKEVDYWDELCAVMDWSVTSVTSTLHICWGAQAGIYHHYGIGKVPKDRKISGVYPHTVLNGLKMLLRGFDQSFLTPHSRWMGIDEEALAKCAELEPLVVSPMVGTHIVTSKKGKHIFVFGHMEYDAMTLADEYFRDLEKGENPAVPYNYFPDDDPKKTPLATWRAHANLLFSNWLNYHVYQTTPYDISQIG
ncbi:MAG: homoserine O-succinyltransferase [Alphaproteobacteria bacterium]|nr:homoserine O-succinyltransferase [Alphaproteobacteria bacterium]